MIEIYDEKGKKVYLKKTDIFEVKQHFIIKKPSVRCAIQKIDGEVIYSSLSYKAIEKLLI